MPETFIYDSWQGLLWIILMSTLMYAALIGILRAFGKRTLTNVNMFDLIITIGYGSALSTIIILQEISFADGFLVLFMMSLLQVIFSKLQMHSELFTKLVKEKPVFLYYQGNFNEIAIKRQRLQEDDLLAAIRKQGLRSFEQVEAMTLEGDGTLAIMEKGDNIPHDALEDVIWLEK